MTELQLKGAQTAIDILTAVAPIALVMAVGIALVKMVIPFLTGRKL